MLHGILKIKQYLQIYKFPVTEEIKRSIAWQLRKNPAQKQNFSSLGQHK